MKYDFNKIEKKWQKKWSKNKYECWKADNNSRKPRKYVLGMFPYPSGAGLHMGHVEVYTGTDILSRYYRHNGFNVLHPIGWDAFGLPAEVYALKHGIHPREAVKRNVKHFREQIEMLGFSYDWNRLIDTTDPDYYKWTQWMFLKFYEKGLAYEKEMPVNFCPHCQAVLADEEVESGKCFRCGSDVERKNIKQWVMKITDYAERLLKDIDKSGLTEKIKTMQRNWIGKSEGYEFNFKLENSDKEIKVFTTRLDTLFGVTFIVLSPEHPMLKDIIKGDCKENVLKYIKKASQKSDLERLANVKEKTGVFTGCYAVNPANYEKIPVWVSDYVLMSYGTGAVMAVPGHDKRDFEFAKKFNLEVKKVIQPISNEEVEMYDGEGILINSGPFTHAETNIARDKIAIFVGAKKKINYKMRDWVFSRQRFWGEPIPIIKCPKCGNVPLKEKDLPLKLPNVKSYKSADNGLSPLENIKSWVEVKCPVCGSKARRETNTMPQWAGSCWYFLRFIDPKNRRSFIDIQKEKKWMPINIYIGGVEHAVTHWIYARFWQKVLYDLKLVTHSEPFEITINQGLILGEDGEKMSKSTGNVVNPEDIVKQYGSDVLRIYEMFLGSYTEAKPWNVENILGVKRFLEKTWNLYTNISLNKEKEERNVDKNVLNKLEVLRHKTIKKVSEDIENAKFNTAISSMMEYLNALHDNYNSGYKISKDHVKTFVVLLSPFAPHMCEEIWSTLLGNKKSIQMVKWPSYKEEMLVDKTVSLIVQVNGKLRDVIEIEKDMSQEEVTKIALNLQKVQNHLANGVAIKKVVFIPNKTINFVV